MHLFGETPRGLIDREDFLRENLGNVLVVVRFADDKNGLIRLKQRLVLVVILVHAEHLKRAGQILNGGDGIRLVAAPGDASLDCSNQPAQAGDLSVFQLLDRLTVVHAILVERFLVRIKRVTADVKTEQFLFRAQDFIPIPLSQVRHGVAHGVAAFLERAKK